MSSMDEVFIHGCHPWMTSMDEVTDEGHGRSHNIELFIILHGSRNANPLLLDAGAAMKFEFCMLKNTAQADF